MSERIMNLTITIAPELIADGELDGSPSFEGSAPPGVSIIDLKMKSDPRGLGESTTTSHLWKIIGEHDHGTIDNQTGVHDLARVLLAKDLLGSKGFLVKFNGGASSLNSEVRIDSTREDGIGCHIELGRDSTWMFRFQLSGMAFKNNHQ